MPYANTVAVTTGASLIFSPRGSVNDLEWLKVLNPEGSGATVYLGNAAVTTTAGWPLDAGATETFGLHSGEPLYGIVAAGSVAVNYMLARNSAT